MPALQSILLVEDDRNIAGALVHALKSTYQLDLAATGKLALAQADHEQYDLIILDLHLPDASGFTICQELRKRGFTAPILILTAEANILSKIKLLDAGADDYLTKPFSLGELKARLRALSRKYPATITLKQTELEACGLVLNRATHTVKREGQTIALRRKEFALLECLMGNAELVVSRLALSRHAWQGEDNLWTNTVDVHINHLRRKIDRPFAQPLIQTVHGIGYKLSAPSYVQAGDSYEH